MFDSRILGWFIGVLLATAQFAHGAGVTIITHGSEANHQYPGWLDDMGAAIASRAGSATAVYKFDVEATPSGPLAAYFTYESGTAPSDNSTNAEVVIKLFWYNVAGLTDTITTTDVAAAVTPFFEQFGLTPTNSGPALIRPLVELPIHLIGHSRGGSMVSEIARLLATHGIWVDQMTTLDPHPQTPADCILFVCPGAYDAAVNTYDNVLFADNYYQIDNSGAFPISGEHIDGAAEEPLTPQFEIDGINDLGNYSDHIEVHDWYYGTIDETATTASGDPLLRSVWYPFALPYTYARGFQFSRVAGGQALREHTQLQMGFTNVGWKFDTNSLRSPNYTVSGTQWPNVFLDNTNGTWTVQAGQSVNLQVRYRDAFSSGVVTIDLGIDDDQNPYNDAPPKIFLTTTNLATGNFNWFGTRTWIPTPEDDGKFVYARITDANGLVRYYYLTSPFHVIVPPPPSLSLPVLAANGAAQFYINGTIGQHYTVQFSHDLMAWTNLTAFTSTNSLMVVFDSGATSVGTRFYRAVSP
jgi:hypothetical protein